MSTGRRSDKHQEIISQVFALVSESSHADKDNTEWTLSTAAGSQGGKVIFQDRMKIFRLMINIMMYQDTGDINHTNITHITQPRSPCAGVLGCHRETISTFASQIQTIMRMITWAWACLCRN